MAIADMKHLSLLGMREDKKKILDALLKLGVVEIAEIEAPQEEDGIKSERDDDALSKVDSNLQDLQLAIELLGKAGARKSSMFSPKPVYTQQQYDEFVGRQQECFDICSSVKSIDQSIHQLEAESTGVKNRMLSLNPWRQLDVPLNEIGRFKSINSMLGTIPVLADVNKLRQELNENIAEVYFERISEDKELIYAFVVYSAEKEEVLFDLLRTFSFNQIHFNDVKGTVSEEIKRLEDEAKEISQKEQELRDKYKEYTQYQDLIEVNSDHLTAEKEKLSAESNFVGTKNVFAMTGWVPADCADKVKQELCSQSDYLHIKFSDPEPEEEFPVLMENPRIVQPVELITELYSAPNSRSIDPTLIMAPFYWFFFGMMLSDAAYGVILSILTFVMLKKIKPQGTLKKILEMLFVGGIFVIFWGALFGSWFGGINDIFKNETLGNLTRPIWFNPLDDPIKLLIWSFIFGAIHLLTALFLEIYKKVKRGQIKDALMDQVSWVVLLVGIGMQLVPSLAGIGRVMIGVGVAVLVLTQGREEKNIIMKLLKGILSLYDITAYLSDVLSYSRLLALGLATGVIATVINTMGMLAGDGVVGTIVLILVFIVGHTFNLIINVLGAYVHSSRLQYVEFFGKFFEGGGKMFRPLKRKNKYFYFSEGV